MSYPHYVTSVIYEGPAAEGSMSIIEQRIGCDRDGMNRFTEALHQRHLERFPPREAMPTIAGRIMDRMEALGVRDRSMVAPELLVCFGSTGGIGLLSLLDARNVITIRIQQSTAKPVGDEANHLDPINVALPDVLSVFLRESQLGIFNTAAALELDGTFREQLSRLRPTLADLREEQCELALAAAIGVWYAVKGTLPAPRRGSQGQTFQAETRFNVFSDERDKKK